MAAASAAAVFVIISGKYAVMENATFGKLTRQIILVLSQEWQYSIMVSTIFSNVFCNTKCNIMYILVYLPTTKFDVLLYHMSGQNMTSEFSSLMSWNFFYLNFSNATTESYRLNWKTRYPTWPATVSTWNQTFRGSSLLIFCSISKAEVTVGGGWHFLPAFLARGLHWGWHCWGHQRVTSMANSTPTSAWAATYDSVLNVKEAH